MLAEIKKLFSSPFTYISLLMVFAFLSVFIVNAARTSSSPDKAYERFLAGINSSDMTEDAHLSKLHNDIESLQMQMAELGDSFFSIRGEYGESLMDDLTIFHKVYNLLDYKNNQFPNNRKQIINDSIYKIIEEKQKENPNKSAIKSSEFVIKKYNKTVPIELKNVGNIESMQMYFDNTIWEYAMLAFIIMLTVRMFTVDISSGAYKMIHSSRNGRRHLFKRQFLCVSSIIAAVTIVVALIQLVIGITLFGVSNFSLPLQMYPEFEFCPFAISIGGFLLLKLFCKVLFYIMIATVTSMVSILLRNSLSAFAISLIAGIAPLIAITYFFTFTTKEASAISAEYKIYNNLRGFVPHGLLNIRSYFRTFDYVDLFGLQISRIMLVLLITAVIIVTGFIVANKNYGTPKEVAI